jgi:o-succinylbenzoate synthase
MRPVHCWLVKRDLPLTTPLITAAGPVKERMVWSLAIDDDAGHIGLGEAAPLAEFGSETPEQCFDSLRQALTLFKAEFIAAWLDRGRPDASLGKLERLLAPAPCARQAIEGALLDLLAQQQGKSLAALLAAAPAPRLAVTAQLGGEDQATVEAARQWAEAGFSCFKLKVGGQVGRDTERVCDVRAAIGPAARLRVDANAGWTLNQALEFVVESGEANLEFCEQPLAAADFEGSATLRRRTGVKIALDEGVRTAGDIGRIAAVQAADAVILKPMFLGGWRPTFQAAQLARSCGLEVLIATVLDGAIGRAHAIHYAAALALGDRAHGLATGVLLTGDLTTDPLTVTDGFIQLPDTAGLGIGMLKS